MDSQNKKLQDIGTPSVVRATPQDAIMHNVGLLANYVNDGDINRAEAVMELLRIQIKTILGHSIENDIWKKLSDLERENIAVYFEIKD